MRDYIKKKKKRAPRAHKKKTQPSFNIRVLLKRAGKVTVNIMIFTVLVVTLYGCWTLVMTTPYFRLSKIELKGNIRVTRQDIIHSASLEKNINIFKVNVREIGREIEELPWIKKVSVERQFPNTLKINVSERNPIALINLGDFYYFDEDGYIFAMADSDIGWNFPIFSGIDKVNLLKGDDTTISLIDEGITLLKLLRKSDGRMTIQNTAELHFDRDDGITLYSVKQKPPVHLGRGYLAKKLKHAERVYSDLRKKGIKAARLEADFNDRIIVKVAI